MSLISEFEFSKLTHEEQERRHRRFVLQLENLPSQFPVDIKYLVELAEFYKTPIPQEIARIYGISC